MFSTAEWHSFLVCGKSSAEMTAWTRFKGNWIGHRRNGQRGIGFGYRGKPCFYLQYNTLHICKLNVILAFRLGHRFLCNRSLRTGFLLNLLRSSKPGACSQASAIESSLFSANCKTKMYLLFLFRFYFTQTVDRLRLLPSKRSLSEERRLSY